jgi:CRP/FNR family transcriptional regulator, cyclic AMP receptor protein
MTQQSDRLDFSSPDTPVDKINILQAISIFANTPRSILAEVAAMLEEVDYRAGDLIFAKGDLGTSMYVVVTGSVWVHDGDMGIATLYARDVFGEMAALDPEPRSASVTAVEDTRLFQLRQKDLHQIMMRAPAITEGIIQILCQRVRARVSDMKEDYIYLQQFAKVTAAAAAVEAGVYVPEALDDVALRTDALGQLARVFQRMVREVYAREESLKRQVAELRIEIDEAKKSQQVAEIIDTDYFQQLQQKALEFRKRAADA